MQTCYVHEFLHHACYITQVFTYSTFSNLNVNYVTFLSILADITKNKVTSHVLAHNISIVHCTQRVVPMK